MRLRIVSLVIAGQLIIGCKANFPGAPSDIGALVSMQMLIRDVERWPNWVGTGFISVQAITVDGHGEFRNVTAAATWTSSDDTVARLRGNGVIEPLRPGLAQITTTYQGLTATLNVPVASAPSGTVLDLRGLFTTVHVGDDVPIQILRIAPSGAFADVTSLTEWTSSSPRVASIQNGRLTAHEPGNVELTANNSGLTGAWAFGVFPRGCC